MYALNQEIFQIHGKEIIINPIPKASTSDPRDPLSYRGVALSPVTYKVYSTIFNEDQVS